MEIRFNLRRMTLNQRSKLRRAEEVLYSAGVLTGIGSDVESGKASSRVWVFDPSSSRAVRKVATAVRS